MDDDERVVGISRKVVVDTGGAGEGDRR